MTFFIILTMIILHIFADFCVQKWCGLDEFKQVRFWKEHPIGREKKYRYDYLMASFLHSISWAYITFLPLLIFGLISMNKVWIFNVIVIINTLIHAVIDDIKANKLKINLVQDQGLHLLQIIVSELLAEFVLL